MNRINFYKFSSILAICFSILFFQNFSPIDKSANWLEYKLKTETANLIKDISQKNKTSTVTYKVSPLPAPNNIMVSMPFTKGQVLTLRKPSYFAEFKASSKNKITYGNKEFNIFSRMIYDSSSKYISPYLDNSY